MENVSTFLMADMGGTNIRFARGDFLHIGPVQKYKCAEFASFQEALRTFEKQTGPLPDRFVLGVPGPVFGDELFFVNNPWRFKISEIKHAFSFKEMKVYNDFQASSMAIPFLSDKDVEQIGGGQVVLRRPKVVIGPGTGLGIGIVIPTKNGWESIESEGGHVTLPAQNEAEFDIIRKVSQTYGHVSAERLLSGAGLSLLYEMLDGSKDVPPEEIVEMAEQGQPLALKAINMMFSWLGVVAGNLALMMGAWGGVYISGGIIRQPGVLELFRKSGFRASFENKGRRQSYMEQIPTFAVTLHDTAFIGLYHLMNPVD